MVTIYHNPNCTKSKATLETLQNHGLNPKVIRYLDTPPSLSDLKFIMEKLEIDSALPMLRLQEAEAKELGLNENSTNDDMLSAIIKCPKLLERPIVITEKGARICRPASLVNEVL